VDGLSAGCKSRSVTRWLVVLALPGLCPGGAEVARRMVMSDGVAWNGRTYDSLSHPGDAVLIAPSPSKFLLTGNFAILEG
jgi:hypothetical protein